MPSPLLAAVVVVGAAVQVVPYVTSRQARARAKIAVRLVIVRSFVGWLACNRKRHADCCYVGCVCAQFRFARVRLALGGPFSCVCARALADIHNLVHLDRDPHLCVASARTHSLANNNTTQKEPSELKNEQR